MIMLDGYTKFNFSGVKCNSCFTFMKPGENMSMQWTREAYLYGGASSVQLQMGRRLANGCPEKQKNDHINIICNPQFLCYLKRHINGISTSWKAGTVEDKINHILFMRSASQYLDLWKYHHSDARTFQGSIQGVVTRIHNVSSPQLSTVTVKMCTCY